MATYYEALRLCDKGLITGPVRKEHDMIYIQLADSLSDTDIEVLRQIANDNGGELGGVHYPAIELPAEYLSETDIVFMAAEITNRLNGGKTEYPITLFLNDQTEFTGIEEVYNCLLSYYCKVRSKEGERQFLDYYYSL